MAKLPTLIVIYLAKAYKLPHLFAILAVIHLHFNYLYPVGSFSLMIYISFRFLVFLILGNIIM